MAGKSIYASNRTLEYHLRSATVYVALFTTLPDDAGAGGMEVAGGSYARKAVTFAVAANGQTSNSADLIWEQATANWGSVVGFGIYDAASNGNPLYLDNLSNGPVDVDGGRDQFMIPAGTLVVQES